MSCTFPRNHLEALTSSRQTAAVISSSVGTLTQHRRTVCFLFASFWLQRTLLGRWGGGVYVQNHRGPQPIRDPKPQEPPSLMSHIQIIIGNKQHVRLEQRGRGVGWGGCLSLLGLCRVNLPSQKCFEGVWLRRWR